MSDCWITEEVFKNIQSQANPREYWRKYLAVWPDWNVNGQFVTYDIKAGESLKVWKGPTSSQYKKKTLPDHYLEGGEEQIVFKLDRADPRNDTMHYFKQEGARLDPHPIDQKTFDACHSTQLN